MRLIDADEYRRRALEVYPEYWEDVLDEMSTVEIPDKNVGKWTHDGSKWANRFICSECGYKLFDKPTNYCPNCGAEMEA